MLGTFRLPQHPIGKLGPLAAWQSPVLRVSQQPGASQDSADLRGPVLGLDFAAIGAYPGRGYAFNKLCFS